MYKQNEVQKRGCRARAEKPDVEPECPTRGNPPHSRSRSLWGTLKRWRAPPKRFLCGVRSWDFSFFRTVFIRQPGAARPVVLARPSPQTFPCPKTCSSTCPSMLPRASTLNTAQSRSTSVPTAYEKEVVTLQVAEGCLSRCSVPSFTLLLPLAPRPAPSTRLRASAHNSAR
jgi:hypothetical protein